MDKLPKIAIILAFALGMIGVLTGLHFLTKALKNDELGAENVLNPQKGLLRGDLAWTRTETGATLRQPDLPVSVILSEEAFSYQVPVETAVAYWNAALGREAFRVGGSGKTGVLVSNDGSDCKLERCRAFTNVYASQVTGEIVTASMHLPPGQAMHAHAWWMVAHELGHVLGLEDDGIDITSLMSEMMDLNGEFTPVTAADIERLKGQY